MGHTKRGMDLAHGLCLPSSEVELLFNHTSIFPIWLSAVEFRYGILGHRVRHDWATNTGKKILVEWIPMQDYGVIMRMCVLSHFSHVRLFMTLWTIARQAPLSMGFSRQEYWSGLPCPPPGDLPDPGIEPISLISPVLVGGLFTTTATWESKL